MAYSSKNIMISLNVKLHYKHLPISAGTIKQSWRYENAFIVWCLKGSLTLVITVARQANEIAKIDASA